MLYKLLTLLALLELLHVHVVSITSFYTPRNEVRGGGVYWNHPVRPSVCPSVCRRAVR